MLSTTVEPECRQRPFVMSYALPEQRSEAAAADCALAREATKVLAHAAIHPSASASKCTVPPRGPFRLRGTERGC